MVFSKSVPEVRTNYHFLRKKFGDCVEMYHSMHSPEKKASIIAKLKTGACQIVACTSAMGVVRFYFFFSFSDNQTSNHFF